MTLSKVTLHFLALMYITVAYAAPSAAPAAPRVASLSTAVNLTSNDNPPGNKRFYRDGGYLGVIGKRSFKMNFDTCESGPIEGPNCVYAGGNSFTDIVSPSVVHDPNTNGSITTLCQSSQYKHTWVLNTVNIDGTNGLAYATDIGPPGETGIGMFPAIINVAKTIPTCTRNPVLFPGGKSPQYGGSGSIVGPGGFLYLYAGGYGNNSNGIYVARVDPKKYNTLSAYSYWDGSTFNTDSSKAVSVVNDAPGSSISYSNYYKAYLLLNTQNFFSGIGAQIAPNPWGPFSSRTVLFSDFSNAGGTYQPNAFPQFDTSGKTLVVHYSAPSGFYQKSITVTFK